MKNNLWITWVCVENLDGQTRAAMLNFTAHPVVTMLLPPVSSDFPGAASLTFEKEFPKSICLFTNGAAGNVNSVFVTTSHDDAHKLGEKLAQAAIEDIKRNDPRSFVQSPRIQSMSNTVQLDARGCPPVADAKKLTEQNPSAANLRLLRLAHKLANDPLRAELQAMSVGGVKWISFPGEPFVETGLALKKSGASFVVGYANGYLGYFPIRRSYDEGGYEVELGAWSRVAPGSAEKLESEAKQLLATLG